MRQKLQVIGLSAVVLALLVANVRLAYAKQWEWWHWHKGSSEGQPLTWGLWSDGEDHRAVVEAALTEWSDPHNTRARFMEDAKAQKGPDITIISKDYGCRDWWGLATVESYDTCNLPDHNSRPGYLNPSVVLHVHVRYNTYWDHDTSEGPITPSDVMGVILHEIGHALGLDHSADYCMGKGYFKEVPPNDPNRTGPTNYPDVNRNVWP